MTTQTKSSVGLMFQAFWGSRSETAGSVAARVLNSLRALDGFRAARDGRWVDADARTIPLEAQAVEELVSRSIPTSIDGKTFPEQGYSVVIVLVPRDASPHESRDTLRLEVRAGSGLTPKHSLANSVIVDTTSQFPDQETYPLWSAAFDGLVEAWRPDHAALLTRDQRRLNERALPDEVDVPWVGAITYLSRRAGQLPPADFDSRSAETPDGATLYLSTSDPLDALTADAVQRVIDRALAEGWHARIPPVYEG